MATAETQKADYGILPVLQQGSVNGSTPDETQAAYTQLPCIRIKHSHLVSVIVLITVLFGVTMVVTLPLYSQGIINAGSDPYVVVTFSSLWFPIIFGIALVIYKYTIDRTVAWRPASFPFTALIGFLNSLNGILVVYASDPARTPPYLQAILSCSSIPFTVIFRYIILRKGVSMRRLTCAGIVLIGLFISTEPQIWGLDGGSTGGGGSENTSTFHRIFWPMIFTLGFLPVGIINVLFEKELKGEEDDSLTFVTWVQLFNFLSLVLMFWTDFLPGFGMAKSPGDFLDRFAIGVRCNFNAVAGHDCSGAAGMAWLFISAYCVTNLFILLVIKYAEGAIFGAIVMALITPVAALFWTVFKAQPSFHWNPVFNYTTGFTLVGLTIMVPAVICYNYFSQKDQEEQRDEDERSLLTDSDIR